LSSLLEPNQRIFKSKNVAVHWIDAYGMAKGQRVIAFVRNDVSKVRHNLFRRNGGKGLVSTS